MPNGSDIAFIFSDKNTKSPGDPGRVNGIPLAIEEHYQNAVKQASWFVWKSMWRASVGIAKGMAVAGTLAVGAVALAGMFAAGAEGGTTMVEGLKLVPEVLGVPGTLGAVLAIGAAAGAIFEVSNYRDKVQRDLIKNRQMMRDLRGVVRDQELGVARAHEYQATRQAVAHDFDSMAEVNNPQGEQEWMARAQQRQQDHLAKLQAEAEAPRNEMNSAIAREEARRVNRATLNDEGRSR